MAYSSRQTCDNWRNQPRNRQLQRFAVRALRTLGTSSFLSTSLGVLSFIVYVLSLLYFSPALQYAGQPHAQRHQTCAATRGLSEARATRVCCKCSAPQMFAMVPIVPVSRGCNQQPCVSGEEELITPSLRQLPCPVQILERADYFARTAPTGGPVLILPAYNKVLNAILAWRIEPGNYRLSVSCCKKLDLLQNNKYLHHITVCKFWCFSWQRVKSKECL